MSRTAAFKKLLEPLPINHVVFRNRVVKSPQRFGYAAADGGVSQRVLDCYEGLARGGAGVLIVGHAYIDFPQGSKGLQLSVAADRDVALFARLAEVAHRHGCPVIQQISHAGPEHNSQTSGKPALGPSELGADYMRETLGRSFNLRALTAGEIEDIILKFARSAERVKKAGLDGVEIHAGNDYLLASFLSRVWNRRDDDYGTATLENRTRLAVAVLRAIRESVGPDFLVGFRMNGAEYGAAEATTVSEGQQIARQAVAAGADYLNILRKGFGAFNLFSAPDPVLYPQPPNPGWNDADRLSIRTGSGAPIAAAIKEVVSVPVIIGGGMTPVSGEAILRNGAADAIGFGRPLLADPEFPRKLAEGRWGEIVPCINCGTCQECNARNIPVICRVNPALGREREMAIIPAAEKRRVAVVGGGPAGMAAARMAALRGHDITLYEKEPRVGGLLPLAALVKGTEDEDLMGLSRSLQSQLKRLGVKIRRGETFPEKGSNLPDVIILANGGTPAGLGIPGSERSNVVTTDGLRRRSRFFLKLLGPRVMGRLTRFWLPVGQRVAIIGGAIHGCEAAEFLVRRGRKVTILEESDELGAGMPDSRNRKALLSWLNKKGTVSFCGVRYREFTEQGLRITNREGQERMITADTFLVALPPRPDDSLLKAMQGKVPEVHLIGDALRTGLLLEALEDGWKTGLKI
ncbi:MAG: FAD-dependent oxidoreductase [Chloroflexota bacterium]